MQFTALRYDTAEPVCVDVENGAIRAVTPSGSTATDLPWVAPGFVDLQVNGYGGQEFNDLHLTVDRVAEISRLLDRDGVTSYCPTATTHGFEMLSHALSTIATARDTDQDVARRVIGIHLEGPYISPEEGPRGAHPLAHVRPPDWDEFQRLQQAARGQIRILTMSPEYEGSAEFIDKVVRSGVLVAIGHTSASSDQIDAAVDAGAALSTHLGNGAHGQIRRHPNYIWDQLADDRLTASVIADGHHLPPSVLKTFLRAKTVSRCILVSDVTGMAGMPPGVYENSSLGNVEILPDGRLVVAGQRQFLAGAALPIGVGVANLVRYTDADLRTAVDMASMGPMKLLTSTCHTLAADQPANLVVFEFDPVDSNSPLSINATINAGAVVFGRI